MIAKELAPKQAYILMRFLKEDFFRLYFKDKPPFGLSPENLFKKNSRFMSWAFSYFVGGIRSSDLFDIELLRARFAKVMHAKDKYARFSEERANRKRLRRRRQGAAKSLFLQQVQFSKTENVHPSFKGYRRVPGSHGRQ
jgi:hypothetical protein